MSDISVLDRLKKRRKYPIQIEGDDKAYIRSMTIGELDRAARIETPEHRSGFVFGCSLVDDNGQQCFVQRLGSADETIKAESDKEFAERVLLFIAELSEDVANLISEGIQKLRSVPPVEELKKS